MKISFEGIGEVTATFLKEENSTVKPGQVVCLTGNETVGLGTAGKSPCGVAAVVAKDGYVGVQISGLAEVSYSGDTTPTVGWNKLTADGNGGVAVAASTTVTPANGDGNTTPAAAAPDGVSFLVVRVDTTAKTAVVKL